MNAAMSVYRAFSVYGPGRLAAALLALLLLLGAAAAWVSSAAAQSAPAEPTGLTTTRTAGQIVVSWNAVSGATGYSVVVSQDGRHSWTRVLDNRNVTTTTITGVDHTLTYHVAVQAVNSSGESGWVNSPGIYPGDVIPGPPRNLQATRTAGQIVVTWSAPANAGFATDVDYHVNYSNDHKRNWTRHPATVEDESVTLTADNTLTWYVAVRSVTAGGWSDWVTSGPIEANFLILPAPESVTITGRDADSLVVNWSAVTNADSYNVNLSANGGFSWSRVASAQTGVSFTVDSGSWAAFNPGATYIAAVQAVESNVGGAWAQSAASLQVVKPGPPASVTAARSGEGSITATWTAPINDGNSAVTGYDVNISDNDGLTWARKASNVSGTSATLTGVNNATEYVVSVRARNAAGGGPWLNSARVDALGRPTSVAAYRGLDFIEAEWPHVAGATGYDVNYSFKGSNWTRALDAVTGGTGATRSARITGVTNQHWHVAAVRARNANGPGAWTNSNEVGFADYPLPVTGLSVGRNTSGEIDVTWNICDVTAWSCTGGSPITEFWVNLSDNGRLSWSRAKTVAAADFNSGDTVTLTGVTDATDYVVAVSMRSRVGGKWVLANAPAAGLSASSVTAGTATLTLSVHTAQWWYKANTGPDDSCRGPVAANTATENLAALAGGTSYTYTAYRDASCASAIGSTTFTTLTPTSHQTGLGFTTVSHNEYFYGMWSDDTTMWILNAQTRGIEAYKLSDKSRDSSKDFPGATLIAAGNSYAAGIWSDGTTMWVGDYTTDKIYAYKMSDKSRDADNDFEISGAGNDDDSGFTSDGVTMWVTDWRDNKLYAYSLTDGSRDPSRDFNSLHAGNRSAGRIWTDGSTMWVHDYTQKRLYAYQAFQGYTTLRPSSLAATSATLTLAGHTGSWWLKETAPTAGTCAAGESDFSHALTALGSGATYTYKAYDKSGCADADEIASVRFTTSALTAGSVTGTTATLTLSNYTGGWWLKKTAPTPAGTCTTGETDFSHALTTLTAGTRYTYKAYDANGCASADEITSVTFKTSIGLTASDVTTTSATLTLAGHTGGWWLKKTAPTAGTCTAGETDFTHALSGLAVGAAHVHRAYDASGCADANEMAQAAFNTPASGDTKSARDVTPGTSGNDRPAGIWSDGTTMWVSDTDDEKLYAYAMSDMSRDSSKDYDSLGTATLENSFPTALWSDGVYMYVLDRTDDVIFAYDRGTQRSTQAAIHTLKAAGNLDPLGIWSDGTTMWVSDYADSKIYAYALSDKSRDASKDFNTLSAAGNARPTGIWSDGTTMWVADEQDDKLYAYRMSDKSRDPGKDYNGLDAAGNGNPRGLWSDGSTTWVADNSDGKVYAYHSYPALLASDVTAISATLTLTNHSGDWWLKKTAPTAGTCVAGEADHSHALTALAISSTYAYKAYGKSGCADADEISSESFTTPAGLAAGSITRTGATLTIADHTAQWWYKANSGPHSTCQGPVAANTATEDLTGLAVGTSYTYSAYSATGCAAAAKIGEASFTTLGPGDGNASADFNTLKAAGNEAPEGVWSDGATTWVADSGDAKIYAYKVSDKSRDSSKDFDTLDGAGNDDPQGIWSDGTTMWVADHRDDRVYAYKMSDKSRDQSKEFSLHADNNSAGGLWSDGATMWVADWGDGKLYAYNMTGKSRDASKDFDTLTAAGNDAPLGLWSDGTTMWASDGSDDKLFAYKMSDKSRDADKDFDGLAAAGNYVARGIWSDGVAMWVADTGDDKLYAYFAHPTMQSSGVTTTTATLTLKGHAGSWWLKKTAPTPAGACTSGETDFSHALSSLTANTTYTYKAYTTSTCAAADEITEVTFTTPSS